MIPKGNAACNQSEEAADMHNKILKALLLTVATIGASGLAGQAAAQGMQDRGISGDRYGYVMRQGKPDPYTDAPTSSASATPTPTAQMPSASVTHSPMAPTAPQRS